MGHQNSMKDLIDMWIESFPQMTKEESDMIETILKWDDDMKASFMFAKRIFEDKDV